MDKPQSFKRKKIITCLIMGIAYVAVPILAQICFRDAICQEFGGISTRIYCDMGIFESFIPLYFFGIILIIVNAVMLKRNSKEIKQGKSQTTTPSAIIWFAAIVFFGIIIFRLSNDMFHRLNKLDILIDVVYTVSLISLIITENYFKRIKK